MVALLKSRLVRNRMLSELCTPNLYEKLSALISTAKLVRKSSRVYPSCQSFLYGPTLKPKIVEIVREFTSFVWEIARRGHRPQGRARQRSRTAHGLPLSQKIFVDGTNPLQKQLISRLVLVRSLENVWTCVHHLIFSRLPWISENS